jgi:hypothetical protein
VATPTGDPRRPASNLPEELAMTRAFYFVGGLVALMLVFAVHSVGRLAAPEAGTATHSDTTPVVAPVVSDGTVVAIDDLAAWPVAAGR